MNPTMRSWSSATRRLPRKVAVWLEEVMLDEMDEVLNGPKGVSLYVPVEVRVRSGRTWAG